MRYFLLMFAVVALVGCGESAEEKAAKAKTKAQAGDTEAQYDLGLMYYLGKGVERDFQESETWMRKAAEQGNADAQNFLKEAQSIDVDD